MGLEAIRYQGSLSACPFPTPACACSEHDVKDYDIKLGADQLDSYSNVTETCMASEVIVHPDYQEEGSQGDIALLKLNQTVNFSRYIRPICLPAANASFPNGLKCTVTGWGYVAPSGEDRA